MPGAAARLWTGCCALLLAALQVLVCQPLQAQENAAAALPDAPSAQAQVASQNQDGVSLRGLPKRILLDEKAAILSPARIHSRDLVWLVPLAGASAAAFATDTRTMRDVVTQDTGVNNTAATVSDGLRDGFIGVPVLLYGVGAWQHQERAREAGLLSGEAMVDAFALSEAVKFVTFRERPLVDNARGRFFAGVTNGNSSFPSGHAMVAWSSAAVLAEEYRRPWQQVGIYALASGVSLTRVVGQQHFPSDVLIGSATGWLFGHYVYRKHHRH